MKQSIWTETAKKKKKNKRIPFHIDLAFEQKLS
ncbi:hypothetical protein QG37_00149 [Candidozyma auris]|uniref:Uncharacterized protein n=1 Tax=Candidozyma auris TaxID=498019 RepID=A0A0L0P966_CANAR|nr:hypothetical protein QG37_00149 [[Candida] auris]